jgi:ATP-dependent helicase/nuclease subunit B
MKSFLQEVAEDLLERFGEGIKDIAIVFNNKRPVAYMQQHFAKAFGKPFWSPSFFTILEFFELSSALPVADAYTQFFTLFHAYNDLLEGEGLSAIRPDAFYNTAQTMLRDFGQVDMELVDATQLFAMLEDDATIRQQFSHLTEEQQQFLEQFWSSFSPGRLQAQQEQFIRMWRRMPLLYNAFRQQLNHQGFTTMGRIYRELAEKPFKTVYSKLVFVGFNALSKAEARVFKRYQEGGSALFYFDTDTYYMDDPLQEAGYFLRDNLKKTGLLNALGTTRPLLRENPKKINVYRTQGRTAQAKLLETQLAASSPGSTAVILADEQLLFPVLQTIPSHIPLNVTMGYALTASPVYGLADLWLTVQEQFTEGGKNTVYYREATAFLTHPLTGISEERRNTLQQDILDQQLVEVPTDLLIKTGELGALFFATMGSGTNAIRSLYVLFAYVLYDGQLKQLDSELITALLKELNRLADALEKYAAHLSGKFAIALMRRILQGIAVPLLGEPLLGLQVMGLLESRALDFEHVFLLGASEGILPKSGVGPQSFIPDNIRRAWGLPIPENQDAVSAYMFYRLLQRSASVTLVYNAQADETTPGEPSRFLRQLEFESGYEFHYYDHVQDMAMEQSPAINVDKQGDVLKQLNRFFSGEQKISATALTTYMNCPLEFFYKYIAGIKEPEELAENVEANSVGSILHLVMEKFYQGLKQEDEHITKERIAAHRPKVSELSKAAFSEVIFKVDEAHQPELKGMQLVILAIVELYVNLILDYDEKLSPFTLVELENKNDYKIQYPVQVNGETKSVTLYGIIDRVDIRNGVTRIVDYKTGGDKLLYSCLDDLFATDSKQTNKAMVQTLFYTYIYEQAKNIRGVEPNLYVVRSLKDGETLFKEKQSKAQLQTTALDECKTGFSGHLTAKLEEIFDPNTPFFQTQLEENCQYCPYLTICGK